VFGVRPQAFVPLTMRYALRDIPRNQAENRFAFGLSVFGRLRPEIGLEQASAGINGLHARIIAELEPSPNAEFTAPARTIALQPGAQGERAEITGVFARPLALLLGVTLVVLLVVCSNVANLLLARGAARANEMTIRAAIGASRRRLMSQLLAEAGVLALIGGIASLIVASLTVRVIALMVPDSLVNDVGVELTPVVILFAAVASLSTVVLFGLAPAIQASRLGARLVVSNPLSHSSGARGMTRFRNVLTTSQVAFSVVLLVLAALFAQSLANIVRVNIGVDVDSLVTFNVAPRLNGYGPEQTAASYQRIEQALAGQPGVTAVSTSMIPLISGSRFVRMVQGFDVAPDVDPLVQLNLVGRGFFATLGVPLRSGRDFAETDTSGSPGVVIVNESFVRRFDLGDDVIGRRFRPAGADVDIEIVGLVADAAYSGSGVKDAVQAQYYQPLSQVDFSPSRYFYVRTGMSPQALMRTIPRIVASVDPDLPVANLRTMAMQFDNDVYVDRLVTLLSASFAILATLLTAIGLFGTLSYTVTQRTRELGLRLALGAEPARLRAMVLKQVGVMTLIGCAVGIAAAVAVVGLAEAILFGVSGYDPIAFVAAVTVLALVALVAGYFPARRASNVAPMAALRCE
jgi:predicted permease